MHLYILNYNNYYDRILKRSDDFYSYLDYSVYDIRNANFDPGDGVSASAIFGVGNYDGTGNYLITSEDNKTVASRWYITEARRTSAGQYRLTLLRDILADFYSDYATAPMYVERGLINASSPYIYNKEDFAANQIKTAETLLKDGTGCPWIIGYLAKNATITAEDDISVPDPNSASSAFRIATPFSQWEYYDKITTLNGEKTENTPYMTPPSGFKYVIENMRWWPNQYIDLFYQAVINGSNGELISTGTVSPRAPQYIRLNSNDISNINAGFTAERLSSLNGLLLEQGAYLPEVVSEETLQDIMSFRNITIIDSNDEMYQITISQSAAEEKTATIATGSALSNALNEAYLQSGLFSAVSGIPYYVNYTASNINIAATRTYASTGQIIIPSTRAKTTDSQFDIFCMPYGEVKILDQNGDVVCEKTDKEMAIAAYSAIQKEEQTFLYDIQLCPYFPLQNLILSPGVIQYRDTKQFQPIFNSTTNTAYTGIFFVDKASFSFNINKKLELPANTIYRKVVNQCDKYRLCSPNYSNYFDFNLNLNGTINYFEVDATYKPYQPYIHIVPQFGLLYGGDFNDPRGLVLGGDFSLSQVNDAWNQYEINNKNYNEIFQSSIQNMEAQHDIARIQEPWQVLAGALQGGFSGLVMGGAMMKNPMAGAIGGVVGAGLSAAAGMVDMNLNESLRQQSVTYAKEQHQLGLENIQALPNTLSKIDSFTPNNKIFPVLEYYTCTEEEKRNFVNKLKYEGMTVNAIGTFEDFTQGAWTYSHITDYKTENIADLGYFRGRPIQMKSITQDAHIAFAIAAELQKGVYTK